MSVLLSLLKVSNRYNLASVASLSPRRNSALQEHGFDNSLKEECIHQSVDSPLDLTPFPPPSSPDHALREFCQGYERAPTAAYYRPSSNIYNAPEISVSSKGDTTPNSRDPYEVSRQAKARLHTSQNNYGNATP
jgi:hypothetical protein